ncbi:T-cell immunoglobulin and mucin domain-containing protein 4 isoform X2 [Danio rerio]|uniref:T-cell immunoglobulin and mucin domain-containing protein 4 isoform X2 n=1 Tax=Danio rerio TaxID=7955 RepID=UPI0004F42555|nr:hepatitis A virus cellular receptor 1 homolog isoform X2 [Danio rerio]|eukprot:XP_009293791.1 hepatitis A virus cellular receptor 1 homolog isoform X2 [Danio rerio]
MIVFLFVITSNICFATCSESSKLVIGLVGDTVTLPCKYDINTNGPLGVCWGRHQSLFSCENTVISIDGLQLNYRESHRFSLDSGLDRGDVSLTIRAVQKSDAGMYVCRIEIPGLFNDISYNVYLFIRSGLDPKRVVSETQLAPTTAKQEKQDDVRMGEVKAVAHTEETMETFIITTVRVGAIIFIPGLIIALFLRLRRYREQTISRTM